jgi:hypothetical protein
MEPRETSRLNLDRAPAWRILQRALLQRALSFQCNRRCPGLFPAERHNVELITLAPHRQRAALDE